jgi:hypothetical protein
MHVLHRCDNPPCINPDHLFLGTHRDNMKDRDKKKRAVKGERHASAKLTAQQVRAIRLDQREQEVIAAEYGISQTSVSAVKRRRLWRHVR